MTQHDDAPAGTGAGPASPFADLLAANADYADSFTLGGFDGVARAGVAIVTCMDSRIQPLTMLGLTHGDAKIFRNPGGRVTDAALQVHGGLGYWSSSPIERVYRDARAQRFEEGTAEIQKTTIARELLR